MRKIFMSAAMLAFLAASCTNEELVQEPMMSGGQPFTLSAEHGMASRTVLDGNQTHWSEGDQIYVSSADGEVYGWLTLKSGKGTKDGEFFGYVKGDISKLAYTIFPAPKSGNVIDLSNRDASNGELDAPMIATFGSVKTSVAFKNETALVKIPVTGLENKTDMKVMGNGIGGELVPFNNNGEWELVFSGTAGNEITIKNVTNNELLVPIATLYNQEDKVNETPAETPVVLSVNINNQEVPVGEIQVQQGQVSINTVPTIDASGDEISTVVNTKERLIAAVAAGGDIKLSDNIDLQNVPLIVENTVTVDLNGKTLTGGLFAENNSVISEGATDSYVFWVKNGGNLTITGNGKVKTKAAKYSIAVWADGGIVTINNGQFENAGEGSDLIYAKNGGQITINDGTFKACEKQDGVAGTKQKYSALNLSDNSGSSITVYGGKYYEFDPSNNKSENPAENFVDENFKSLKNGDWFYVVPQVIDAVVANTNEFKNAIEASKTHLLLLEGIYNCGKLNVSDKTLTIEGISKENVTLWGSIINIGGSKNFTMKNVTFEWDGTNNGVAVPIELKETTGLITFENCLFKGTEHKPDGNTSGYISMTNAVKHLSVMGCTFDNCATRLGIWGHLTGNENTTSRFVDNNFIGGTFNGGGFTLEGQSIIQNTEICNNTITGYFRIYTTTLKNVTVAGNNKMPEVKVETKDNVSIN